MDKVLPSLAVAKYYRVLPRFAVAKYYLVRIDICPPRSCNHNGFVEAADPTCSDAGGARTASGRGRGAGALDRFTARGDGAHSASVIAETRLAPDADSA